MDNDLALFLTEVRRGFDAGSVPRITGELLHFVQDLTIELMKRNPFFLKDHNDTETGRSIIEGTLRAAKAEGIEESSLQGLRQELKNETWLRSVGRDVRVRSGTTVSERVVAEMRRRVVRWVKTPPRCSFIISSLITYRIGNGGPNGIGNSKSEVWIPISPDIAMVLLVDNHGRYPLETIWRPEKVRQINEFAVRHAQAVGSHSERLLQSLLRGRIQ